MATTVGQTMNKKLNAAAAFCVRNSTRNKIVDIDAQRSENIPDELTTNHRRSAATLTSELASSGREVSCVQTE
jgi:hypothetical protein